MNLNKVITQFNGEYSFLSNFYDVSITYDGITYRSVEHAYMAQKSNENEWKLYCSDFNNTAAMVKKASKNIVLVENWDTIKVKIMYRLLLLKFSQEPFKTRLLMTNNEHIQEGNYWNDTFWGVCLKTNKGENTLGQLLMLVRNKLQNKN